MELDRVKELIKLMNDSGLSHLEIDDKMGHIILEKQFVSTYEDNSFFPEKNDVDKIKDVKTIKAPFVGTFYTSEQPDKAPLVRVGDKVEKGQAVGIIEAMKMMNEVKADISGTIDQILVSNGDAVEYDQPLFTLKD